MGSFWRVKGLPRSRTPSVLRFVTLRSTVALMVGRRPFFFTTLYLLLAGRSDLSARSRDTTSETNHIDFGGHSFPPSPHVAWEHRPQMCFESIQMESKEGALSPFNGRFPSSAPRTGQATLRCIRLASEDLAPSPCRWRSGSSTRCESL